MVPPKPFVDNLQLVEKFKNKLPEGDIVECGVWKGGAAAALYEILSSDRKVHLFDSFEGLPEVNEKDGVWAKKWQTEKDLWYMDNCAIDENYAKQAMKIASCSNYKIYKGWFEKTLKEFDGEKIAILRIDGDWYDSVWDVFVQLYDKVEKGGLIIIDDFYAWEGCTRAVYDYLSSRTIVDRIRSTEHDVAYIIKNEEWPFEKVQKRQVKV